MSGAPAVDLSAFAAAFQGVIPSALATVSEDGVPNVIGISHVYLVDRTHVALSEQFMVRTRENLERTGRAEIEVVDPITMAQHVLTARFVARETSGPTVERIRTVVEGVAQATGMADVFRVRGALVCRVDAVRSCRVDMGPADAPDARSAVGIAHLGRCADRLRGAGDLRALLAVLLDELTHAFGWPRVSVLLADESGERLFTCDSRGFPRSGAGSEVVVGQGLLGGCARTRTPIRIGSLWREARYARASAAQPEHDIPLPGLPDAESLLAVPIATPAKLLGLVLVESPAPGAFSEDDQVALSLIAQLSAPTLERVRSQDTEDPAVPPPPAPSVPAAARPLAVRHYQENDSVFLDQQYLVKGVAGRILWLLLSDHAAHGRTQFTNRELRLDPRLGLSALRDNLEARMILLRKRLADCAAPLSLPSTGRGRFRLVCERPVTLDSVAPGRV